MLINKKKLRQYVNSFGKQCSMEFMLAVDAKIRRMVISAVGNAKHFKRLTPGELITLSPCQKREVIKKARRSPGDLPLSQTQPFEGEQP